ncbi:outer membrane protein [Methylocystis sp. JAN1]|uniref:outer membrane protein n=1 Tax=Methylocystis sp. JAN1 TaxID=3397211 RepID=UPI003FA2B8CE
MALAAVSPAGAADLPSQKAPAPPPLVFTWTGLYVGLSAGYAWTGGDPVNMATANILDNTFAGFGPVSAAGATGTVRARLDGFLFGGQLGYNWQLSDRLVAGMEADIQGAGVRGGNGQLSIYPATIGFAATSFEVNRALEYLGTVRGRLGYTITPAVMAYVTGGFAYGGANLTGAVAQSLRPSLLISDTVRGDHYDILTGWTIGAGAEAAISRNLSAKAEYLYYDLGELWLANPSLAQFGLLGIASVVDATSVHARYNGHVLRAGLNYRFDASLPETSGSPATPLLATPQFASVERPEYDGWRWLVTPYFWATNMNGASTLQGEALGSDMTFVDAITKSSSFPLAFMGRVETSNGPFWAYGDLAWARLRFAGSALSLRSPVADLAVAANVSGHLRMTLAIGEAGFGYELARWKLLNTPNSFTAIDAYAGLRYANIGLNLSADFAGAANSSLLGVQQIGGKSILGSGALWWIDPVIGLRMRHSFTPGGTFEMRGDIGGFGAGSKFSWQFFGGYNTDFEVNGVKLTGLIGYRALGMNFSKWVDGRENGVNAVIHGPVTGVGMKF